MHFYNFACAVAEMEFSARDISLAGRKLENEYEPSWHSLTASLFRKQLTIKRRERKYTHVFWLDIDIEMRNASRPCPSYSIDEVRQGPLVILYVWMYFKDYYMIQKIGDCVRVVK